MQNSRHSEHRSFGSSPKKAENKRREQEWDNEGGYVNLDSSGVRHVANAALPYVAVLELEGGETIEQAFATMHEAEAFIKRNTPTPRVALSSLYDGPCSEC